MKTNPFAFKRSKAMMEEIQIIAYNNTPLLAMVKINALVPYKSRGHGKCIRHGSRVKAHNKMLRHQNVPPFNGKNECRRRVMQDGAKQRKKFGEYALSTPRRMWRTHGIINSARRTPLMAVVRGMNLPNPILQ